LEKCWPGNRNPVELAAFFGVRAAMTGSPDADQLETTAKVTSN